MSSLILPPWATVAVNVSPEAVQVLDADQGDYRGAERMRAQRTIRPLPMRQERHSCPVHTKGTPRGRPWITRAVE